MKVNDIVTVKIDGAERREGVVLAVEPFLEGRMYLVALSDYPAGIWFFNEEENPEGIFCGTETGNRAPVVEQVCKQLECFPMLAAVSGFLIPWRQCNRCAFG